MDNWRSDWKSVKNDDYDECVSPRVRPGPCPNFTYRLSEPAKLYYISDGRSKSSSNELSKSSSNELSKSSSSNKRSKNSPRPSNIKELLTFEMLFYTE